MARKSQYLKTYTRDYKTALGYSAGLFGYLFNPERPVFFRTYVPQMLRDPHIWYGMEILKGPIVSKAKFIVECSDMEAADYAQRQIDRFWARGASKALDCFAWGYSCSEVLYEFNDEIGGIEFKDLKFLHQRDVRVVTKNGELCQVQVKGNRAEVLYLKPPKVLWTVHDKKVNRWYGRSRLEGAFDTWWEIWQPKGYRGLRHLWFYKNAFSGGVLYYPDGSTQDEEGNEIPNVQLAEELLDRKESGASIALPNRTGDNRDWEWEQAEGNPIPEGLLEYGDVLRDEMWEGIGVPPEVAKQEGTGSFAGRRVPQQAFYSNLQELANDLVWDFDEQVLSHLMELRYGDIEYAITPVSILQTLQEEEMGLVTGKMGDEGGDEEQEFDEEGNPIETEEGEDGEEPLDNGRIEDRDSNSFNLTEKANKNAKPK